MKIVVLDAKTLGSDISLDGLKEFGEVVTYETTSKEQTQSRVKDADIILTNKVVITKEIMSNSSFKLICETATGTDNIDLIAARELGIEVKNVAGYSTNSVVQMTFSLALYLLGKMKFYDEFVKSANWAKSGIFTNIDKPFNEISGKTWGIIGLGNIGKKVASIAECFGCNIQYYSTSGKNSNSEYKQVSLDELMSSSDIISIHAPMNENTNNLITSKELNKMHEKSILLNLGRGGIVNEDDLACVLDEKEIYAGLDVTKVEPLPLSSPLYSVKKNQDRLVITPHIAWASVEARTKLMELTLENIREFLG
ncbi:MAG: D-3-phosphoglycerate dehydrogenase (EC [uncultured Campylobacterales bacterium]|uniref:D-3-phosphoglycerate dehydrogenase (EC) n=1 Tax=uncultured Campylobacterales bacterium TaxID=352960 RepID=A0A6S6SD84_9BACT|nr:MAG: D-3-phosphoglycerate dehydrogenase (EC [uncultured Campylobacterales bacterium]